ncbi:MAG: hypothetical protein OJF47_002903 [Nitrospira sp.]|jgi:hypothetical protein|nr:MAG: hypothetical protein OJF47_002903 [Nitrospira sp.]
MTDRAGVLSLGSSHTVNGRTTRKARLIYSFVCYVD